MKYDTTATVKRPRTTPTIPLTKPTKYNTHDQDYIEEVVPIVKCEPSDPTPSTVLPTPIQTVVQQEQSMTMYQEQSQEMQGNMMSQYEENYAGEYDAEYGDGVYYTNMGAGER